MDWNNPNAVRTAEFERWLSDQIEPTLNNRVQCEPQEIDAETECEILRAEVESLHGVIDGKDDQIRRLMAQREELSGWRAVALAAIACEALAIVIGGLEMMSEMMVACGISLAFGFVIGFAFCAVMASVKRDVDAMFDEDDRNELDVFGGLRQ